MNPYASFLGDQDPIPVISATPGRLDALLGALGKEGAERPPAPGKWSAREILCHLADCELVFAYRLRQALAEPYHTIQPFDQEKWANTYSAFEAREAVDVFTAVRKWNIRLIESLPAEALSKLLTHPERGEMTLRVVVETMGGHDINHLRQIEGIASQAVGAA
jgi:uncharacterized damage-inducible protein DinB